MTIAQVISIHAPARGATRLKRPEQAVDHSFQSTLPHGERLLVIHFGHGHIDFNPRSRTGSDTPPIRLATVPRAFQSTLPHGERHTTNQVSDSATGISIHAPARGATLLTCLASALLPWFQSTLPHGERLSVALWLSLPGSFNPRSRTGSDLFSVPFHFIQSMFQSTLPHGERHTLCHFCRRQRLFQSTLPHGERPWALC